MTKVIKYEKRMVFFIDILGFKEIIKKDKDSPEPILRLFNIIKTHLDNKSIPYNITQFSDSIIISFKYNSSSILFNLINKIIELQVELIKNGCPIRGACSIGNTYHNGNIAFGDAINDAYFLESKCAVYPRIIISQNIIEECFNNDTIPEDVIDLLFKESDNNTKEYLETVTKINKDYEEGKSIIKSFFSEFSLIKQDTDGYFYINYFSSTFSESINKEYLAKLKSMIIEGLKNKDNSVRQKYSWMKDKYNKCFKENQIND